MSPVFTVSALAAVTPVSCPALSAAGFVDGVLEGLLLLSLSGFVDAVPEGLLLSLSGFSVAVTVRVSLYLHTEHVRSSLPDVFFTHLPKVWPALFITSPQAQVFQWSSLSD